MVTSLEIEVPEPRRQSGLLASIALLCMSFSSCAVVTEPLGLGEVDEAMTWAFGPPPLELERDLSDPAALAAAALAEKVQDRQFPAEILADCESHAARFTWLAARSDSTAVVEAALWAMLHCRLELHSPDVVTVVAARLDRETEVGLLGAAIELSIPHVEQADRDAPLIQGLVKVAVEHRDMGVRIAALEALDERVWSAEGLVAQAFYEAVMAEWQPSLTAFALGALTYRSAGFSVQNRQRFLLASMVLASDIDPGIRGYAALALARISPEDEDVQARVLSLLDDKHPYTRSAAAEALADMAYQPAIHELIPRLNDQERNVWRMLPWTRPNGQRSRLRFTGSHFERVDDAFLRSLERLTADLETPFVYREVNLRFKALDIVAATRDAQRWYAEHGEQITKRGVADEPTISQGEPPTEDDR